MKIFSEFIVEANRKAQRASKSGRTPKEGSRSKGDDKPKGVVTVGLPGSGKSTIAKHMVSKGNTDQHELDKSRQALGKGPAHFGQDIVHHTYSGAKKSAKQGRSTVLSNTSIPKQHRQDAIDKLKDAGYENVKAVLSPGSTKAAMRRNRKRTGSKPGEGAVPQFVMNRMAQGMKGMSRAERRELRGNYKELHKSERFTKPAMKRSGAIREAKVSAKTFEEFINEARRMRILRTAHYNNSSAVRDIHDTGFRQGTRSDGTYHDKGMNVVYTTPSSRVGADYGSKRVHFKLVNPKVTNIDSPKNYGKRIKDWMRDSSDDDLVNDRNRPKDSFKQSREAIRGGSKVIRVPDAHGGHDEPKKGNRGSYIILDKEVANKSIDRNPQPTIRSKDKKRRTQTQPKKRLSEFLEIVEKYYAPDEKLPSGKTPEEKAEDRIDRPFSSRKRSLLQQIRLRTRVRHGADNPELNRHPSPQSDVSGGPGWMSVGDKESGIYYNVTHHGRTKDGKRVFNVTWNHSDKPSELEKDPERRTELVRAAKDVWKQDVEHRLPHGSVVTNRPTENSKYDDQKGEIKKNTRSKLYQRAGFGEMNPETGKQFAQVGRQLNTKQKRKGKGRLTPLPSDTEYEFTNS